MCASCLSVWRRRSVCIQPQLFHSSAAICGRVFSDRQVISQPLSCKQTCFQRTNKQRQMSRHNAALTINIWAWTGKISVDAAKQLEAKRGNEKRSQSGWGDKNAAHWNQNPDRICSLSYAPYDEFTVEVCNGFHKMFFFKHSVALCVNEWFNVQFWLNQWCTFLGGINCWQILISGAKCCLQFLGKTCLETIRACKAGIYMFFVELSVSTKVQIACLYLLCPPLSGWVRQNYKLNPNRTEALAWRVMVNVPNVSLDLSSFSFPITYQLKEAFIWNKN